MSECFARRFHRFSRVSCPPTMTLVRYSETNRTPQSTAIHGLSHMIGISSRRPLTGVHGGRKSSIRKSD